MVRASLNRLADPRLQKPIRLFPVSFVQQLMSSIRLQMDVHLVHPVRRKLTGHATHSPAVAADRIAVTAHEQYRQPRWNGS